MSKSNWLLKEKLLKETFAKTSVVCGFGLTHPPFLKFGMVLGIKHLKVIERLFPSTREAETEGISVSLRPAWHMCLTPGRSGLYRRTLSQKLKKKESFNFLKQITCYVIRNILQVKNILCSWSVTLYFQVMSYLLLKWCQLK